MVAGSQLPSGFEPAETEPSAASSLRHVLQARDADVIFRGIEVSRSWSHARRGNRAWQQRGVSYYLKNKKQKNSHLLILKSCVASARVLCCHKRTSGERSRAARSSRIVKRALCDWVKISIATSFMESENCCGRQAWGEALYDCRWVWASRHFHQGSVSNGFPASLLY